MLVQMVTDVQSYYDKAWALELESKSARTARNNARAAVRKARRALREALQTQTSRKSFSWQWRMRARRMITFSRLRSG